MPHSIIRTGRPYPISEAVYLDLVDEMAGICRDCGTEASNCEPDARGYHCQSCGSWEVYGLEELLVRGELALVEGDHA